jgi:hypothetical protein
MLGLNPQLVHLFKVFLKPYQKPVKEHSITIWADVHLANLVVAS